ncbi:MAG TPA: ATP-binding protein [Candidatus Sulfotelmatobacter sp.]|nr:ATP-binding protein [Candidatus Sulfotelmatobacter sp.]
MAQCQRQGNVIGFNSALEQMFGSTVRGPAVCFADLICSQERAAGQRLLEELFDRRQDSFQLDSHVGGADGRPVRWTLWRVSGTSENSDYALALAEDAPHDHLAEQRLRQAEKLEAVGRLAGGVAHDFNNLLTGILLYCDLLKAHLEPCHRVRKYADEIRNAGMQAASLVRQLLAVARPSNSEARLLSLNEIVEGMRNLLARLIGENINLQFRLDPNVGLIKMDPTQAQQILLNLVLNARDAMPRGGEITVETSQCKVQVLLEPEDCGELTEPDIRGPRRAARIPTALPCALFVVADNGSGMDAATHAHVFDAFFTTKAGKGTGLGLATVHDIVTSNGGLIHIDSAPARGTRVSVLLPLVPAEVVSLPIACDSPTETNVSVVSAKE